MVWSSARCGFCNKRRQYFITEHKNKALVTGTEIKMRVYSEHKNEQKWGTKYEPVEKPKLRRNTQLAP